MKASNHPAPIRPPTSAKVMEKGIPSYPDLVIVLLVITRGNNP
jgi:hypothetical protein